MRKLHPIHARERLVARGGYRRPGGTEMWSLHALPLGRHVLRVHDEHDGLWHLVLDDAQRPERLQARLRRDGKRVEATLTFFEDEVLIWRRGAEPTSEALAVPPGSRLLWPPLAGRLRCLGLDHDPRIVDTEQPTAVMTALLRLASPARGLLTLRPVKFTLRVEAQPPSPTGETTSHLRVATPGLPSMVATLDASGQALRWHEEPEGDPDRTVLLGERILREDTAAATTGAG